MRWSVIKGWSKSRGGEGGMEGKERGGRENGEVDGAKD